MMSSPFRNRLGLGGGGTGVLGSRDERTGAGFDRGAHVDVNPTTSMAQFASSTEEGHDGRAGRGGGFDGMREDAD